MTKEEKAKAYDEALERARTWKDKGGMPKYKQGILDDIFPELKESEDERIRKAIVATIHLYYGESLEDEAKEMIDWLEKQGKQKGYTFKSIPRLLDMIEPSDKAKAYCQKLIDTLVKEGYNTDAKIVEEVLKGWNGEDVPMAIMDEQKPVFEMKTPEKSLGIDSDTYNKIVDECIYGDSEQNPADKLEPKFHKGEWIVWKDKCYKVNYNGCGYELVDQDGLSTSLEYGTIDENAHIWDVTTDAKDGDVLISRYNKPFIYNGNWNSLNIGSYCGITTEGMFNVATEKCYWTGNVNIHPATKEQRDLLFSKMKESDYKWDAEKKELKKIDNEEVNGEDYGIDGLWHAQRILEKTLGEVDGYQTDDGILDHKAAITAVKKLYGQEPTDNEMKEALRTEYEKGRADAIAEMQNPAWSEEDEEFLRRAINATKDVYPMTAKWLKFLKDRVQPKQEWSEEDECYMSECIGAIATKDGWSFEEKRKTKHWLKSLKERIKKIKL